MRLKQLSSTINIVRYGRLFNSMSLYIWDWFIFTIVFSGFSSISDIFSKDWHDILLLFFSWVLFKFFEISNENTDPWLTLDLSLIF